MKILITGAGGYIGSSLISYLNNLSRGLFQLNDLLDGETFKGEVIHGPQEGPFAEPLTISGYDNLMYNQGPLVYNSLQGCKFRIQDVTEWSNDLINDVKEADVIIPLAAIVGAPACDKIPAQSTSINYTWFEQLLEYINPNTLVIYPNTNSGYGSTGNDICTEETPSNPISLYGKNKQQAEDLLLKNHKNSIVFRLATVFGWSPRPRLDLLINNLTFRSKTEGNIEIFDAHFRRNYIHVKDICKAFIFAIESSNISTGQAYNLGNDSINCTKKHLAEVISSTLGTSYSINQNRTDPDKRDYEVSSQKLYNTGYIPDIDLITGIKELNNFYNFLTCKTYDNIIKNY